MSRFLNLPVVPWRRIDGHPVHTNGVIEEALGLTPLIAGWCGGGLYVAPSTTIPQLKEHLNTINWRRVYNVNSQFSIRIRSGRGVIVLTDTKTYFVTEKRFQRLVRVCFKAVPQNTFDWEVNAAKRSVQNKTTYHSGCL